MYLCVCLNPLQQKDFTAKGLYIGETGEVRKCPCVLILRKAVWVSYSKHAAYEEYLHLEPAKPHVFDSILDGVPLLPLCEHNIILVRIIMLWKYMINEINNSLITDITFLVL